MLSGISKDTCPFGNQGHTVAVLGKYLTVCLLSDYPVETRWLLLQPAATLATLTRGRGDEHRKLVGIPCNINEARHPDELLDPRRQAAVLLDDHKEIYMILA
jgi:hypothetical protein